MLTGWFWEARIFSGISKLLGLSGGKFMLPPPQLEMSWDHVLVLKEIHDKSVFAKPCTFKIPYLKSTL